MRILIDDFVQSSDAPDALKSPALSDVYETAVFDIDLGESKTIDSIGIGFIDATSITVNGVSVDLTPVSGEPDNYKNGLYLLGQSVTAQILSVSHNGTYLGRFAAGVGRFLGAAPSREPGFYSTEQNRITASGQRIPGAGGISGRVIGLDFRYKIDQDIFKDFENAHIGQLSKQYPLFLYFDKETHRMPWRRFYGSTDGEILFQSSVNFFKYSRRFEFKEAF